MHHPVLPNNFLVEFDLNNAKSLWFGIETYGNGNTSSINNQKDKSFGFRLEQNYPNPFNPNTTISYSIPELSNVSLKVYDVLGREVATLVNEEKPAGNYSCVFDASHLPSGIYLYSLNIGNQTISKKFVLMK